MAVFLRVIALLQVAARAAAFEFFLAELQNLPWGIPAEGDPTPQQEEQSEEEDPGPPPRLQLQWAWPCMVRRWEQAAVRGDSRAVPALRVAAAFGDARAADFLAIKRHLDNHEIVEERIS